MPKKKLDLKNLEWKTSIIKSIIYRAITLVLGTLTAYVFTGSLAIATGTALLTEAVQAVNYFVYELIWSNYSRKKIEKEVLERMKRREVEFLIDLDSLKQLAFEMSLINTFIPRIYLSVKNFYKRILANENLKEIHEEVATYKENFELIHSGRKMFFEKDKAKDVND